MNNRTLRLSHDFCALCASQLVRAYDNNTHKYDGDEFCAVCARDARPRLAAIARRAIKLARDGWSWATGPKGVEVRNKTAKPALRRLETALAVEEDDAGP